MSRQNPSRQHQPDEDRFRAILPEDIAWQPFPAFPPGARLAVMVGHPAEPGPYVVRVKVPGGTRLMPHKHPEDRIYTVMSGVFYIGLGESFDGDKVSAYPPGSVIVLPARDLAFPLGEGRRVCHAGECDRAAGPRISRRQG
ncbi:cupin domain-containing protein [Bradyrhizobium ottawaense]|uniref:ChrR-like cupin domain-containing protein n=1 Tax=Bradyrhizobium ottawaense TaxID=931866 RepID=A0ABV4G6A7_9BRAD